MNPALSLALPALVAPLLCFGVHVLVQRVAFSREQPRSRILVAARIAAVVTILCSTGSVAILPDVGILTSASRFCYTLLTAGSLSYCYFIFFTMSETARRIRVLVSLYENEVSGLTADRALGDYGPGAMLDDRLARLLAMGAIRFEADRVFVNRGWMYFGAAVVEKWRSIFYR